MIADKDFAAIDRAAAASIDIAATLEALARSAVEGRAVNLADTCASAKRTPDLLHRH